MRRRHRRPPLSPYQRALLKLEALETRVLPAAISLLGQPPWLPVGPGPINNGQPVGITVPGSPPISNPVSGSISALAVQPDRPGQPGNPDIVFAGTVNGGIWETTNATADRPTWTPLTDLFSSPSISALAYDLSDPDLKTLYAGTGTVSSARRGSGEGLLKTTDGGAHWTALDDPLLE